MTGDGRNGPDRPGALDHGESSVTGSVEIRVPAHADYLHLTRLAAEFVALKLSMNFDGTEDLRLAVDELCSLLLDMGQGPQSTLALAYVWDEHAVEVSCTLDCGPAVPGITPERLAEIRRPQRGEMSELTPAAISDLILEAVADEHGFRAEAGAVVGWLRKSRHAVG